MALNGAAAFAEYATTRSSLVVPVPVPAPGAVPSDVVDVGSAAGSGGGGGIGPAEAAALVLSGVTACAALEVGAAGCWRRRTPGFGTLLTSWQYRTALRQNACSAPHLGSSRDSRTPQATARIRAGEVVVVTAAAGGTGHFAVQVCVVACACAFGTLPQREGENGKYMGGQTRGAPHTRTAASPAPAAAGPHRDPRTSSRN